MSVRLGVDGQVACLQNLRQEFGLPRHVGPHERCAFGRNLAVAKSALARRLLAPAAYAFSSLVFGVRGLGLGVWGLGFGVRGFKAWSLGLQVCRALGLGSILWDQCFGCGVSGV